MWRHTLHGPLDSVKSIYVEPDGRITVCKGFLHWRLLRNRYINIIDGYDPFKIPEMSAIIENGMKGLID